MVCRELVFEADGTISGLMSLEGEKVSFVESVNPAATGTRQALL
jgi:dynein heavy chain